MADGKLLEGWEGYSVERVEWPQEPRRTLAVHLKAMRLAVFGSHGNTRASVAC